MYVGTLWLNPRRFSSRESPWREDIHWTDKETKGTSREVPIQDEQQGKNNNKHCVPRERPDWLGGCPTGMGSTHTLSPSRCWGPDTSLMELEHSPMPSCTSHTPGDGHRPLSLCFLVCTDLGRQKYRKCPENKERGSWTLEGPPSCRLVGMYCRATAPCRCLHDSHKGNLHHWFSHKGCLVTFVLKFNFLITLHQL